MRALPFQQAIEPDDAVVIGRIVRSIGVRGEVKVIFESDDPERLNDLSRIMVRLRQGCFSLEVRANQPFRGYAKVALTGVDTVEMAELLRNGELIAPASEIPELDEDEYYVERLIGCKVETEDGEVIGTLQEVIELGHHDLWCVANPQGEILIPARKEFIVHVNVEANQIIVRRIAGLWEGA